MSSQSVLLEFPKTTPPNPPKLPRLGLGCLGPHAGGGAGLAPGPLTGHRSQPGAQHRAVPRGGEGSRGIFSGKGVGQNWGVAGVWCGMQHRPVTKKGRKAARQKRAWRGHAQISLSVTRTRQQQCGECVLSTRYVNGRQRSLLTLIARLSVSLGR